MSTVFNKTTAFSVQYLLSKAAREQCMNSFKKLRVPYSADHEPNYAVMVPLCSVNNISTILYTSKIPRPDSSGEQITFPGGRLETKESSIEAALRELKEDVGVSPDRVDVWGHGNPVPGRNGSNFFAPVIGVIRDLQKDHIQTNFKKITDVYAVPIEMLCDPKNQYYTQFRNGMVLPVFVVEDCKIWGLPAYITHALLTCLVPPTVYRNEWTKRKIIMVDDLVESNDNKSMD